MRFVREPLVSFFVLGAVLYAADVWRTQGGTEPIVVPAARVAQIHASASEPAAVEAELRAFAEEEALLREARRLGFDRSDLIVRRRLLQKMAFVLEDRAQVSEPSDAELAAHLQAHADSWREPPRAAFELRFFSQARRADPEGDARRALSDPSQAGDESMAGARFADAAPAEVARRLGADFAAALEALSPSPAWQGPVAGTAGFYLVRLTSRTAPGLPDFAQVRPRLREAWLRARREAAVAEARRALVDRYPLVVEAPAGDAAAEARR